ncbi:uncharacterized protein LOC124701393 [Lolium rigidum]|uniref:uncharacterized protein LOC124701393 n=1 Tax=Lolium rigidum TaxID=89674 RepID=UPI001F5DEE7A|nr:uncharacterized protein LOC124701393 [Lolium rigidum]XP_047089400.1 uncharacterized protein LOC124701393 [Lolium rigidum]
MDLILPFKVGGVVELRSFDAGYRGAWFRCKISDMCIRNGHMEYQVEYMDYPEEKRSWSRLYKVPPKYRRKAGRKAGQNRELMLRPPFPPWCRDNDIPEHGQKMDVLAVVSSPWKVGDLIDWRHTSCFWTGKITELLGDDKAMIVCPEIPLGEGGCYEVDLDDLRPALDWSLEKGWSAPLSKENGECWYTARLVTENPDTGSSSSDEDIEQSDDGIKEVQKCWNGSFDTAKQEQHNCLNGSCVTAEKVKDPDVKHPASRNGRHCMKSQPHSEEEPQKCTNEEPDTSLVVIRPKAQLTPDESDECCTNIQAEYPTSPMANSGHSCEFLTSGQSGLTSLKKLKTSTECASVQQPPGTAGDALMDLEKVASKIRRAQDLLQSIDDTPSSRAPSWRLYR